MVEAESCPESWLHAVFSMKHLVGELGFPGRLCDDRDGFQCAGWAMTPSHAGLDVAWLFAAEDTSHCILIHGVHGGE